MNKQSLIITIEVTLNERPYVFSLPYGAPFEESISAANQIVEIISQAAIQAAAQKTQEPSPEQSEVVPE